MQRKQSEIDNMDALHLIAIEKQEHEINKTINEIKQLILDLKSLPDTCHIRNVSTYKSEFRELPPKLKIILPNFFPQKINIEGLLKQFGFLSPLSIETEEQSYIVSSPGAESSLPNRLLLDAPRFIADIPTCTT